MPESIPERIRHYVLNGSDRDLRRLLSVAEVQAESARAAIGALKSRLVGTGVAAGPEVDELELSLRQAASTDGWLTSPFMLDLALRKE